MFWIFSLQLPERTYCVQTIRLRIPPPPFGFGLRTCGTAVLPGRTDSLELRNRHMLAVFSRCPHPARNGDRYGRRRSSVRACSGTGTVSYMEKALFRFENTKIRKSRLRKNNKYFAVSEALRRKGHPSEWKRHVAECASSLKKRWLRIELRSHAVACKTVNYLYIMIYN